MFASEQYCCEACKLGMISGSMGMGCEFQKFSLSETWDETYQTCCTTISEPEKQSPILLPAIIPSSPSSPRRLSEKKHQSNGKLNLQFNNLFLLK